MFAEPAENNSSAGSFLERFAASAITISKPLWRESIKL
jgi:hypothetical protein